MCAKSFFTNASFFVVPHGGNAGREGLPASWQHAPFLMSAALISLMLTSAAVAQVAEQKRQASARPTTRDAKIASKAVESLPRTHGQVLRKYDIRRYTQRVKTAPKPEQAIVDWILRETGTDVWFGEPLGFLSASRDSLLVYHTPEMQQIVSELLGHFLDHAEDEFILNVKMATVSSPNWRTKAAPILRPVSVQSPGIEAWLVSKEGAIILYNALKKRADFREIVARDLVLENGQSHTFKQRAERSFVRSVRLKPNELPGYELLPGQLDEGYTLSVSPLFSSRDPTLDAVITCHIDQVERLVPLNYDLPNPGGPRPRVQVQIPQLVSWRLHERFRWQTDQVLVLSCGVVATPGERAKTLGLPNPFTSRPGRADGLMFIEAKGRARDSLVRVPKQPEAKSR